MPLYEYRCKNCGHTFEELVLGQKEPVACPECRGHIERVMSSFSIDVPDELCAKLPRGEKRERCTACRHEPAQCPISG
jgi:putative FmdB family regulatory protein